MLDPGQPLEYETGLLQGKLYSFGFVIFDFCGMYQSNYWA